MATNFFCWFVALFLLLGVGLRAGNATLQPRAPNFQYFERFLLFRGYHKDCSKMPVPLKAPAQSMGGAQKCNFLHYARARFGRESTYEFIAKTFTADILPSSTRATMPKYRYPYYDLNGKGKLLYGYGGTDLYQYKAYSPLEGVH